MRALAKCGTESAYRRHLRWGQVVCWECQVAHAETQARYRAAARARGETLVRELRPCGTEAAYRRHLRRREIPCPACCRAHADEFTARYQSKRAAA